MKSPPEARIVYLCRDNPSHTERSPARFRSTLGPERGTRPLHLTVRERQVLSLLCEGLSNKHICRRLDIATGTVKCHIASILGTLGVSSRLQAVVEAQRLGLVPTPGARAQQQETSSEDDADRYPGAGFASPHRLVTAVA
jgi:ATP/maltotriose-dependent transcriptional regulator MalT